MPMDPMYPEDRMRYIMDDAGMRVLVMESAHVGVVSGLGVKSGEAREEMALAMFQKLTHMETGRCKSCVGAAVEQLDLLILIMQIWLACQEEFEVGVEEERLKLVQKMTSHWVKMLLYPAVKKMAGVDSLLL